jgi:hypothetical protein
METLHWLSGAFLSMDFVITILLILLLASLVINQVVKNFSYVSKNYLWLLFGVHYVLTLVYILYASSTASDSYEYYRRSTEAIDWFSLFETGTRFISFFGGLFSRFFGLSYYSIMMLFSFFGFIAILLFYLSAKENISLPKKFGDYTYAEVIFLLPNIHFWSSSLGKGSVIMMGLALFTFGLSRFNRRLLYIIIGSFFVFMVRPHIFLALIVGIMLGLLVAGPGLRWYWRALIFLLAGVVFYLLSDQVVEYTEVGSLNFLASDNLSHKVSELGKADSGVDIGNYNIAMKLFTFWFRPLFVDGLSVMGLMASFENAIYLFMFFMIISRGIPNWNDMNGWFRICFFVFLLGSVMLAQVSGNLGIAMRQKAQMMPFLFIFFCKVMSYASGFTRTKKVYYSKGYNYN